MVEYTRLVESARGHAATLLGTSSDRVAIGATASAFVALAAAAAPPGAEVVVVDGDFASVVRPFLARGDLRVTQVPLAGLAEAVGPETWMVAYALVQSATGEVADAAAVRSAARDHGARVLVDTTQATGWLPTTDLEADVTVCHTYKWLCGPRGSAFAAFSARAQEEIRPLTAGWYSALDPWASCYGPELDLAPDASRYDLSPAWHAWVGAEAALGFTVSLDAGRGTGARRRPRQRLPRPAGPRPVGQRDRRLARPRRRRPGRDDRRPASRPRDGPAGPASPSTSGTTRRTST